jgi:hypothetical protein
VYATAEKVDLVTSTFAVYSTWKALMSASLVIKGASAGVVAYSPIGWTALWSTAVFI